MKFIGEIEALAAQELLENGNTSWVTTALVANRYPEASALEICFALSTVAANLEAVTIDGASSSFPEPLDIYRTVSAIASDVCYIQASQEEHVLAGQLAEYWSASRDEFFVVPTNSQNR